MSIKQDETRENKLRKASGRRDVDKLLRTIGCSKENNTEQIKDESKETKNIFEPRTFKELIDLPPKKWFLDQVFGAGDIGMIYGAPGCGKTFLVIDMIINLCIGGKWSNKFCVNKPLNVAYCAGEGISGLPSRFESAAKYYNIKTLNNFTFFSTPPQLYEGYNSVQGTIKTFVEEWEDRQLMKEAESLDVLVIDTLHTATVSADENSAQDMGKVLQSCRFVADKLGCAVILVHHTNKGGTSERGSSAMRGAMDFMIEIKKGNTEVEMICSKLKDGEQWETQRFSLIPQEGASSVRVLWNGPISDKQGTKTKADDKKTILDQMERHSGIRFNSKSLSEVLLKSQSYTTKLLEELVKEKKCQNGLSDPMREKSSRNPWVYWIDSSKEKKN
jgi:hypothetical protein